MKVPDFSGLIRELIERIPKHDIEKVIFKGLLGLWLIIVFALVVAKSTLGRREDIEKKIMQDAVAVTSSTAAALDIERYEALLNLTKYPEDIQEYTRHITRDPFTEYAEIAIAPAVDYDFALQSIDHMALPMVYRGYIELSNKIIGQINWREATRFVESGSVLNGYRINKVSKKKIEASDDSGRKIEFKLNKPVLGDEMRAILYDNISKKTFDVQLASEIGDYKVIDIAPNYVILHLKGEEIRLEK